MTRVRVAAAALLLTVSGSALADAPARLALPLPTVPAVALGQVLGGLPEVTLLLGQLGLVSGSGAVAILPGLPDVSGIVAGSMGSGMAALMGGLDDRTNDPLPGLLPELGKVLMNPIPGGN